jgi:hypothetical protein
MAKVDIFSLLSKNKAATGYKHSFGRTSAIPTTKGRQNQNGHRQELPVAGVSIDKLPATERQTGALL